MKQKKQAKQIKKVESGRSMIEMVGVLAVMGLITAAAFVLITSALKSQKLTRVDDDLSAISSGIRLLYANQYDFTNLTDTAAALKLIGYDTVKSPYATNYTLDTTGDKSGFIVSFDTGDEAVCTALQQRTTGSNGATAGCVAGQNTGGKATILQVTFTK